MESASSGDEIVMLQWGSLTAQIWHGTQGVIEAVREIRRANYQCQLDDLPLIEIFPQVG